MAWTTPPTFTAGTVLTAADLNIMGDDLVYLYGIAQGVTFSGVQLNRSSNQSISNATNTAITWTTERFDYGGWWSSGTAIVVPAGAIPSGYTTVAVLVLARLKFASNSTGTRRVLTLNNGVSFGQRSIGGLGGGDETDVDIQEVTTVAAGDSISIAAYQSSGGALNCTEANVTVLRYAPAA